MQAVELGRPFGIDGLRQVERRMSALGPTDVMIGMRAAALNVRDLMFVLDHYQHADPSASPRVRR